MKKKIKRIAITVLAFLVVLNGLAFQGVSIALAEENAGQDPAIAEEATDAVSTAEETIESISASSESESPLSA